MWDRAASYGSEQYHVGLNSLMWVRPVSCETEQSLLRQSILMWVRPVSCGSEKSYLGQSSVIWDRPVSCGTDETEHKVSKTELLAIRKKYLGHSAWYYSGREQSHVRKSNLM